jgi:hypothetical protein
MNLELDYTIHLENLTEPGKEPVENASDMDLRYYYFPGNITLRQGKVDLSAKWGWIPIFDFALALKDICKSLQTTGEEVFEFTESDATLSFRYDQGKVLIAASYANGEITVNYAEFEDQVGKFYSRLVNDMLLRSPGLERNVFFTSLDTL